MTKVTIKVIFFVSQVCPTTLPQTRLHPLTSNVEWFHATRSPMLKPCLLPSLASRACRILWLRIQLRLSRPIQHVTPEDSISRTEIHSNTSNHRRTSWIMSGLRTPPGVTVNYVCGVCRNSMWISESCLEKYECDGQPLELMHPVDGIPTRCSACVRINQAAQELSNLIVRCKFPMPSRRILGWPECLNAYASHHIDPLPPRLRTCMLI